MRDRERLERIRVGMATAALINIQLSEGAKAVQAWDIFPDLRQDEDTVDDDTMTEAAAQSLLAWFRGVAARQQPNEA